MRDSARPLRVLAVTNMYPTSASPAYGPFVASQMDSIAAAGHAVTVDFIDGRRGPWEYVRGLGRITRLASGERFDVVHAHYGLTGCVAFFQRLPLVVSFYGDDVLGTPDGHGGITLKSRVEQRLSTLAAWRAEEITCQSAGMQQALRRAKDRSRVHVIPSGVDTRRFCPGDRAAARQRLGLGREEGLVLFPSHAAVRRKRLDLAAAATELAKAQGFNVRLWIVQGLAPTELPDYYRAADCMLLTSDWEGSPNVVKEAICCDLPVVSVDAGDARQWVALAPGCMLVERDAGAIARGITNVLSGARMADGRRVRAELAIEAIAQRVIAVYRSAIAKRESRAAQAT